MSETDRPVALLVDDDPNFRASLEALVAREGFDVRAAESLEAARRLCAELRPAVVLIDLALPDGDGLAMLREDAAAPGSEVIVITGHASVESAVEALREGALDYLTKPVDRTRLKTVLTHVGRTRELKRQVEGLRRELRDLGRFGRLVGRSKPMQQVYDWVARVAPTSATVLVTGESGTGKELVARTVHELSKRRDGPYVAVNCGAMAPSLIESELFGHERGSFTGADRRRQGCFEHASGGTLLLDEITEMPAELQVKLLRVLEAGEVVRVGATTPVPVDVRLIACTNRSPEEAVREERLREDLYHRLNVFPIALPPLRERPGDVELLAEHALEALNREEGTQKRLTREALRRLQGFAWPGNVRELQNLVHRAFILAEEEIGPEHLPEQEPAGSAPDAGATLSVRVGASIAEAERRLILATLDELEGDKRKAAELLGISLKTLYNRLNVYQAGGQR